MEVNLADLTSVYPALCLGYLRVDTDGALFDRVRYVQSLNYGRNVAQRGVVMVPMAVLM